MNDRHFDLGGKKFQLGKIDAFKQFHIVRKIAPILADLIPAMKDMQKVATGAEISESEKLDQFAHIAAPLMKGLSNLSDQDADKVLMGLLNAVEQQMPGGSWAKVARNDMLMIQDLELPVMLQLAGRAFMFNLSGFFAVLHQVS